MDLPGFDIRYTYVTDTSHLREWISNPSINQWFPMSTEKEIEDAVQCWIGFCRWSSSLTATIDHVPCAIGTLFLMPYRKVAHQAIFKLVVDPKRQRQGIGTALVRNLKHLAKNYFRLELIGIEIFEGNPIESLLKKQGFEEIFRQNHYMKDSVNDRARIYMEVEL
jgi:ribosomal protein S18 acetylase RimI-like enzyme